MELRPRIWKNQKTEPMPLMVWVRARWPDPDSVLGWQEYMTFLDGPNRFYWTAQVALDGMPVMQCRRDQQPIEWLI
jgi:hypothetical protein